MNLIELAVALTVLSAAVASQVEYAQAVQALGGELQAKQVQVDTGHRAYLDACRQAAGLPAGNG